MINDHIVENVIAHCQEKWSLDVIGRRQQGNAILFSPMAVFDEGGADAGRNQLLDFRDHPLHFIADDEVDCLDPGAD